MDLNHKILGEGEPIIIMHGLFGMLDNWLTVAKSLAEDYMVILLDLRNHGKSPHSELWSVSLMAEDVRDFMEKNWIHEAVILGHSMGGKVAMQLALTEPDLVEKLIIVDIAPKKYKAGHQLIFEALHAVPIEDIKSRQEAEESLGSFIDDKGVCQFLLKNIMRKKEGGYRWKMNLKAISENYETILESSEGEGSFDEPSLFIAGGNSNYILPEDEEDIQHLFTDAQVKRIDGAGHWVHADKKDELLELIRGFMNS